MKKRVTRKESREQLEGFRMSCELIKVIRHFFPQLWEELRLVKDPRHPSHITYSSCAILLTRILSAIFYISSMRKASEELNTKTAIKNIGKTVPSGIGRTTVLGNHQQLSEADRARGTAGDSMQNGLRSHPEPSL